MMFVKLYKYKIKKKDLQKLKRIHKAAQKIYKRHGAKHSWTVLLRREKGLINVLELNIYTSKKHFLSVKNKVDQDKSIHPLFEAFLNILHKKRYYEEEWKTYN